MLIGTVCLGSARFVAVTTTSSRAPGAGAGASCACAPWIAANIAAAIGACRSSVGRPERSGVRVRASFLNRLRCIWSPLYVVESAVASEWCQRRCVRVGIQHRPEGGLERLEPGLEMPPLLEPLTEDRLAHLLGARGAHGALVLVETQALLLEW